MLQQLRVEPGMRVLEIGAGTGYNAALLAELVGPSGAVTTVDIGEEIAAEARGRLASAGYPRVAVIAADGAAGWPPNAPYDRIELSVGASDITPAWYEQLRIGGLVTLPLWLGISDASVALRKHAGALVSESLAPCGFMRLRGSEQSATAWVALDNGRRLGGEWVERLAEPIRELLATRPRRRPFIPDPSLMYWLGLRGLRLVMLSHERPERPERPGRLPKRPRIRFGVFAEGVDGPSLSLLAARLPLLLSFGGDEAERRILAEAERWRTMRRIPLEQWRVTAWPHYTGMEPPAPSTGVYRQARRYFTYDIAVG